MRFISQSLRHTKRELIKRPTNNEALERERERESKDFVEVEGQYNFAKDNEYFTPKAVVDYFGRFDYDPSTTPEKAKELQIENYDTIETNGLLSDWSKYKKIWINPPFSEKHKFVEKAYETYKNNQDIEIYILFPIEFLTTRRFYNISNEVGAKIYIPNGRIPFQSGLGKNGKSPAFGSVIIKIQKGWEVEQVDIKKILGE